MHLPTHPVQVGQAYRYFSTGIIPTDTDLIHDALHTTEPFRIISNGIEIDSARLPTFLAALPHAASSNSTVDKLYNIVDLAPTADGSQARGPRHPTTRKSLCPVKQNGALRFDHVLSPHRGFTDMHYDSPGVTLNFIQLTGMKLWITAPLSIRSNREKWTRVITGEDVIGTLVSSCGLS